MRGSGPGIDAVRTLARHLIDNWGGCLPVGITRQYDRGPDGTWHDCL
ncbi:hypothetical protein ACF08B_37810 [Streptomyces sp. NPDC015139]